MIAAGCGYIVHTSLKTRFKRSIYRKTVYVLIFVATFGYAAKPSVSDEFTDRRLTAGAKIFRALLAADMDIASKTRADGNLGLCLLYVDNAANAQKVAATLTSRNDSRIRNLSVTSEILPLNGCLDNRKGQFAGIFLTQQLSDENLAPLIRYANAQNVVVFSPLEGDVERGVQSGIAVEARVRPFLNTQALKNAEVRLKSFFIRVSKRYER